MMEAFERELTSLINRYSVENGSGTPDFILAQFLVGCLAAFNATVTQRETWYGRGDALPTYGTGPAPNLEPDPPKPGLRIRDREPR